MEDHGKKVEDSGKVAGLSTTEENNKPAKECKTSGNENQKIERVEHLVKVELFNTNGKNKAYCLRNWLIFFACALGVILLFVAGVYLIQMIRYFNKDWKEVCHSVSFEEWKMYADWGHLVLLAIVGGLFGYTLYLIKRAYDSEAYERKKDLELNRKLYQEKVAHELSEPYRLYQQRKDVADKMFALEKTCLEAKINKEEFDAKLKSLINEIKSSETWKTLKSNYDEVINDARWQH